MARPQRSTKDLWIDQFEDWDVETQESLINYCALLHRQAKRREKKKEPQAPARIGDLSGPLVQKEETAANV